MTIVSTHKKHEGAKIHKFEGIALLDRFLVFLVSFFYVFQI